MQSDLSAVELWNCRWEGLQLVPITHGKGIFHLKVGLYKVSFGLCMVRTICCEVVRNLIVANEVNAKLLITFIIRYFYWPPSTCYLVVYC